MRENLTGRVSRAERDIFTVLCEEKEYAARLGGAFFEEGADRPVTGDVVTFSAVSEDEAVIEEIWPRKSVLKRADGSGHAPGYVKTMREQVMAANFDYGFILTSLNENYNLNRIARYVAVILEGGGIPVVLLTKADLCADTLTYIAEVTALSERVRVHAISAKTGEGLDEVRAYLKEGTTVVLLGSSGVGKSTLVNRLVGREVMKTGEIREKDGKGRHTTTTRQMIVADGVTLIDTPGMRELGLIDTETGVSNTFEDVEEIACQCRFSDCTHGNEPGCAIRKALENGELDPNRWKMYSKMKNETNKNAKMKAIAIYQKKLNAAANRKKWD